MIVNTVIPMIIREIEDQEIRITGLWDNRDLPMITEKDFASVDPLQILPINGVDCFVRFYGDEGTVLMKSKLYDLKFRDCQKVKMYSYLGIYFFHFLFCFLFFCVEAVLRLHGSLKTRLFFQSLKQRKQRTPCIKLKTKIS